MNKDTKQPNDGTLLLPRQPPHRGEQTLSLPRPVSLDAVRLSTVQNKYVAECSQLIAVHLVPT
jgi:hypothetical protein